MMRIAVVTPAVDRRGGTQKCMSWLVQDLSRRAEVTLFTSTVADTDVSRCRVHRITAAPGPRLLRYLGFLVMSTILVRRRRHHFDVVLATAGDCLYSDIVYAHFCCAAWHRMLRRGELAQTSTTVRQRLRRLHHRTFMRVAASLEGRIYHSPRLRGVVAVSSGTGREITEHHNIPPDKLSIIPNAVDERVRRAADERDLHRARLCDEFGLRDGHIWLLFVAAGDWERKRLALLLDAVAALADERCRLLVVGDDDIPFYRAQAARLAIADRVVFCGFQAEVERFYAAADVFVYPSTYEAFSLVTLEAAGAGLPLVVTSTNGTEELLRDGENGWVVECDVPSLAGALRALIDDPTLRARMGSRARSASKRFTREAVADSILRLCAGQTARGFCHVR